MISVFDMFIFITFFVNTSCSQSAVSEITILSTFLYPTHNYRFLRFVFLFSKSKPYSQRESTKRLETLLCPVHANARAHTQPAYIVICTNNHCLHNYCNNKREIKHVRYYAATYGSDHTMALRPGNYS